MGDLQAEAEAFNDQIKERVANGHIPDLRRAEDCDYFFNNSWRRKATVELDFGQIFERIANAIEEFSGPASRVLEVGCGPGFMSLEMARAGHDVTGIDIADAAIDIARRTASEDPWYDTRGDLAYAVGDFQCTSAVSGPFDAVVFVGSLHHFPDQDAVMRRTNELLDDSGIIVAYEPTRDRYSRGLAEFVQLLRVLLSVGKGYYKDVHIPIDQAAHSQQIDELFHALLLETEEGENLQSPHDNDAGYTEMTTALHAQFNTLAERDTNAFFHELVGGLRFDEETNAKLARYLRDTDERLVREGILPATEFMFVGRKKT